MTPDNFEGVEEPRKTWCQNRMIGAREWVKSYGRGALEVQLEAALERMVGLELLLNEKSYKHTDEYAKAVREMPLDILHGIKHIFPYHPAQHSHNDPARFVGAEAMPVTKPKDGSARLADVSSGNPTQHSSCLSTQLVRAEVIRLYRDGVIDEGGNFIKANIRDEPGTEKCTGAQESGAGRTQYDDQNQNSYISIEVYDNEIRYDGKTIWKGGSKYKTSEEVDAIVEAYKQSTKNREQK